MTVPGGRLVLVRALLAWSQPSFDGPEARDLKLQMGVVTPEEAAAVAKAIADKPAADKDPASKTNPSQ